MIFNSNSDHTFVISVVLYTISQFFRSQVHRGRVVEDHQYQKFWWDAEKTINIFLKKKKNVIDTNMSQIDTKRCGIVFFGWLSYLTPSRIHFTKIFFPRQRSHVCRVDFLISYSLKSWGPFCQTLKNSETMGNFGRFLGYEVPKTNFWLRQHFFCNDHI